SWSHVAGTRLRGGSFTVRCSHVEKSFPSRGLVHSESMCASYGGFPMVPVETEGCLGLFTSSEAVLFASRAAAGCWGWIQRQCLERSAGLVVEGEVVSRRRIASLSLSFAGRVGC